MEVWERNMRERYVRQTERAQGKRFDNTSNVFNHVRQIVKKQIDDVKTGQKRANKPWVVDQLGVHEKLDVWNHTAVADLGRDDAVGDTIPLAHKATFQETVHQIATD